MPLAARSHQKLGESWDRHSMRLHGAIRHVFGAGPVATVLSH